MFHGDARLLQELSTKRYKKPGSVYDNPKLGQVFEEDHKDEDNQTSPF
jgi:hypothetical protein